MEEDHCDQDSQEDPVPPLQLWGSSCNLCTTAPSWSAQWTLHLSKPQSSTRQHHILRDKRSAAPCFRLLKFLKVQKKCIFWRFFTIASSSALSAQCSAASSGDSGIQQTLCKSGRAEITVSLCKDRGGRVHTVSRLPLNDNLPYQQFCLSSCEQYFCFR